MNLVERFFADLTGDCVREGSFASVRELIEAIDEFLAVRNEEPKRRSAATHAARLVLSAPRLSPFVRFVSAQLDKVFLMMTLLY